MTLIDKISEDLKAAMKSGDKLRLETLRTIKAGFLEKQVEKRPTGGMSNEDEISFLISAAKKRKESLCSTALPCTIIQSLTAKVQNPIFAAYAICAGSSSLIRWIAYSHGTQVFQRQ